MIAYKRPCLLGLIYIMSFWLIYISGLLCLLFLPFPFVKVEIAHLDFWGRKKHLILPIEAVLPPFLALPSEQVLKMKSKTYLPLYFRQLDDSQTKAPHAMLISYRQGRIYQPRLWAKLLGDETLPPNSPPIDPAMRSQR